MKAVIYARVSSVCSDRQDTERQVVDLKKYARSNNIEVVNTFEDYQSGAKPNAERWVLKECIAFCKIQKNKVDCILMSEVSRLGRDIWEMIGLIKNIHDHHINVYFQRENLYMFDSEGKDNPLFAMMSAVFSRFAETERLFIKERLQSGYKLFREKGGQVGRKNGTVKTIETLEKEYAKTLKELRNGTSIRRTAKLTDVSIATVTRLKKKFGL